MAGTVVLTLDGALPVEFITEGDRVITRDSGVAPVRRILRARRRVAAVAIRAGSLGNTRPDRDAILPAGQEILIRDWRAGALFGASQALVPIAQLVDGEFVRDIGETTLDTVTLAFDAPHIVYADGLELAAPALEMEQHS
ncbi:Hint domain-containing protein [Aestuariicoccus sp. MJ-SS9]|uniref:Hint domain-containing protein n=1 Tax=Aestuariicoccus sp. MJ-SS9 TaxID=3079855 RepID=UPI002914FEC3|nr:Hint domain-containing protein [Aestuariicoccus sp. MJ-SS9]MDU8914182.1 Hint domain-containing protein [Aestuariicoccus sp. MJ-SS9]